MAEKVHTKGLGCLGVVGIVFVVLKLLSVPPVAAWSWLWVLSPFWIGFVFEIILFLIIVPVILFVVHFFVR